jgi:hypothetical protein
MENPDPAACTAFLLLSFFLAGIAQVCWLKWEGSRRFSFRLDRGLTLRGRPLLGGNKTLRGLVVMVPAVACFFALIGGGRDAFGPWLSQGLWPLSGSRYFLLGAGAGLAFMLGELPNSFLKRQFDIPPGGHPASPPLRALCFVVDQVDSVAGGLLALSLVVPVPLAAWGMTLLGGLLLHWLFNVLLKFLGMKARAA